MKTFWQSLTPELREELASGMREKAYEAGRSLTVDYWSKGPAVLVDGLILGGSRSAGSGDFHARMYMGPGSVVSLFGLPLEAPRAILENICLTDCTVAFLDAEVCRRLYEESPAFLQAIIADYSEKWHVLEARACCETVVDSVRYFLQFCHESGLPAFTHEKIALACNHSRPAVTRALGELVQNEPELFPQAL